MICETYTTLIGFVLVCRSVFGAQEFYRQPTNASEVQGQTVVLRCIIKNCGGKVQWTRGGFGLGTERSLPGYNRYSMIGTQQSVSNDLIEEFSLKIIDLQLEDDTDFVCQASATDTDPVIVSNSAFVTVLIPPSKPNLMKGAIIIPVILEKSTNVTCEVLNAKPPAQITWKKDGIRIAENTSELSTLQADGKRSDSVGIVMLIAGLADAGKKIECGAWNQALGQKQEEPLWAQATLDVQYAPKVRLSHNSPEKTMREFDNIKFTCTGEANPFEVTWKWYRNGEIIPDENQNVYQILRLPREYHGNTIKCEGSNSVGSTSQEHSMNILFGPKFKNEAQHVSADNGQRAELKCEAEGNPTAEITWRRQGKYQVLHTSSTYVIPSVKSGMFGIYTCTATVLGFNEISMDIYVTENGVPEIVSDATQFATLGGTALIQCMSISSPKPIFVWSSNGQPIDYSTAGRFTVIEEGLPYGGKSRLQILNVKPEDFGTYNCTVTNGRGVVTLLITLRQTEELPMTAIIGGVVGGLAVIFIIVIVCIVYHKCRHTDNESYAETDSNTEIKKRDKNESPSEMTKSTLMDQWRQDYNYRYSADFDDSDTKATESVSYGCVDADRYGTMPTNYPNGRVYADHTGEDIGPKTRFENSYSTGYIPSTFRSPSRAEFHNGRVSTTKDLMSGRVSANDIASGIIGVNDFNSGRVPDTDFTFGRIPTEPLEAFRLPAADYATSKLATNV